MKEIYIDRTSKVQITKDFLQSLGDFNKYEIAFLFNSDFNNAKYIRDYISIILDYLSIDLTWKNRFILVVDELVNNSIEYWSKDWDINILKFTAKKTNDWIKINIEVEDSWKWEKAKNSKEMEVLRWERLTKWFQNHDSIRWRGLFLIITKLVDKLYFKDSNKWGLIVWIDKQIKAS